MTDLNVTEGEWFVAKGHNLHEYVVRSDYQYTIIGEFDNKHNAHLMAQAKNMYEKLEHLHKHECISDYSLENEVGELLNACKPPEE